MACCPAVNTTAPVTAEIEKTVTKKEKIDAITDKTIALVRKDDEGDFVPYCGGVWVSNNLILTAFHCLEEGKVEYMTYDSDSPSGAIVKDFDIENDLAVLLANSENIPAHSVAEVSVDAWRGQHVHVMGHTTGMGWTYLEGVVSSVREKRDKTRKLLQVSSPIWFGNSGGGAWDDDGRLIGISSLISGKAPNVGFFIHGTHIRDLLDRK